MEGEDGLDEAGDPGGRAPQFAQEPPGLEGGDGLLDEGPDLRAGHVVAVGYDPDSGRLTVCPDSAAWATKANLEQVRVIAAANASAGRTAVHAVLRPPSRRPAPGAGVRARPRARRSPRARCQAGARREQLSGGLARHPGTPRSWPCSALSSERKGTCVPTGLVGTPPLPDGWMPISGGAAGRWGYCGPWLCRRGQGSVRGDGRSAGESPQFDRVDQGDVNAAAATPTLRRPAAAR